MIEGGGGPEWASDVVELRQLVDRFALAVDHKDPKALGALFTDDAVLRNRSGRELRGEEIGYAFSTLEAFDFTMHLVANHVVDVAGDEASGTAYCIAHHLRGTEDVFVDQVIYLHYEDTYRREREGWRFASRILRIDWTEDRPTRSTQRGDLAQFGVFS